MRRARSALRSSFTDLIVVAALIAPVLGAGKPKAPEPSLTEQAQRLGTENALLRKQLDLAIGEPFYYVLDPGTRLLRFMFRGNLVQEYRLLDVEVGTRRGFFGSGSPPSNWADRIWAEGELDPPRVSPEVELDTSAEDYEEQRQAVLIPPTPEELYPAPAFWRVRYLEGLTLEVHGVADTTHTRPGFAAGLGRWFGDAFRGLGPSGKDVVRIRLYLPIAQAGELYRAVPPATRFTILHLP